MINRLARIHARAAESMAEAEDDDKGRDELFAILGVDGEFPKI